MKKSAEDLKCGDVFMFRDKEYTCLSSATDRRTTMTILTCIRDYSSYVVYVLRLTRCFQVELITHHGYMSIEVIDNTEEEFNEAVKNGSFEQVGR